MHYGGFVSFVDEVAMASQGTTHVKIDASVVFLGFVVGTLAGDVLFKGNCIFQPVRIELPIFFVACVYLASR